MRADAANYAILRTAFFALQQKYPQYHAPQWERA